jgi:PilZ domain
MRGEGYTRDISPSGVFVLTGDRLPSGAVVKLEVVLPSLRGQRSGACLRTNGHVVRSEEVGFAAAAEMGFRMQLPKTTSSEQSLSKGNGSGTHEADSKETKRKFLYFVPGSSA